MQMKIGVYLVELTRTSCVDFGIGTLLALFSFTYDTPFKFTFKRAFISNFMFAVYEPFSELHARVSLP